MYAIRGATTVSENTKNAIEQASVALIHAIETANDLAREDIIDIIISTTQDITAYYPAAAVRLAGFDKVPLFSTLEPPIESSLPMCIRMLVHVEGRKVPRHVYENGAKVLRPDII